MPKFYCEYCSIYLTHSSPAGRKQHSQGRKHINAKVDYYQKLVRERFFQPPPFLLNQQMPFPNSFPPMVPMMGHPGLQPPIHPQSIPPKFDGNPNHPVRPGMPGLPTLPIPNNPLVNREVKSEK